MRTGTILLRFSTIIIFAVILAGCSGAPGDDKSPGGENSKPDGARIAEEVTGLDAIPEGPVRIAFVPSVEAGAIEMQLEEFEKELSERIDHRVEAAIVLSYTACIEQMASGHFEAALLPPLAYVLANNLYDVRVELKAVRRGSPTYRGQIITRADSGIESIDDLRGKTFGFTSASSTSGYLYPKTLLMVNGIDLDKDLAEYTMVSSDHSAVVRAVLNGRIDAGACFDDARVLLEESEPEVMDEVIVIAHTADIPADTVSFRSDCTGEFYDKVSDAMMVMSQKGEDSVFYKIYQIEELVPAEDSDYDPIREMVRTLDLDIEEELD